MITNRNALYWHSFFLAVTMSFTEINTVMPALVLEAGGGETAVGALTAIMKGLPLVTQLLFASFLHARQRKKPALLFGINLRVVALAAAGAGIAFIGTDRSIIPVVFVTMSLFALSGAFAGVSYTEIMGKVVDQAHRRTFFVNRQTATALGLLVSAIATRLFLGATTFPNGYVLLFVMAAGFLLVASGGFWVIREPVGPPPTASNPNGKPGMLTALREVPRILARDSNMRSLILAVNLGALGFTAIPLLTALAHHSYPVEPATVGWFVIIQVLGQLGANVVWSRVIRRGGFRLVLRTELILLASLLPLSLVVSAVAPLWAYAALYLIVGAVLSAQRLGVEATLVQISPDDSRALYAGVFGAANLGTALMPLATGSLVSALGFIPVFAGAAVFALVALVPAGRLWCGGWYRE
ncbi:MAG: MFS transporter [Spirochaetota bacterium]